MNPWQMLMQVRHELRRVTWPRGSKEVVFGATGVRIVSGLPEESALPKRYPFAFISQEAGESDGDHPEFITVTLKILTAALVRGDSLGESALIGGASSADGQSAGRGAHELEGRVRSALADLTGADGARIMLSGSTVGAPVTVGAGRHLAVSEMSLEALCTADVAYAAPQNVALTGSTWNWEGGHCTRRHDFRQFTLAYRAGSPAESLSDPGVTAVGSVAESPFLGHTAVAGQFYSVFAEYNSRSAAQATFSEGESPGDEVGAYLAT